jgi:hypothetical protein
MMESDRKTFARFSKAQESVTTHTMTLAGCEDPMSSSIFVRPSDGVIVCMTCTPRGDGDEVSVREYSKTGALVSHFGVALPDIPRGACSVIPKFAGEDVAIDVHGSRPGECDGAWRFGPQSQPRFVRYSRADCAADLDGVTPAEGIPLRSEQAFEKTPAAK